jgi:hypothetical protein
MVCGAAEVAPCQARSRYQETPARNQTNAGTNRHEFDRITAREALFSSLAMRQLASPFMRG